MKQMLRLTALFMIVLVLSLPVVFAQELALSKYSGKDGANGYVKVDDVLTIEALTKIPGTDIIHPDNLKLYLDESFAFFDNCTKMANSTYYKCVFSDDLETYEKLNFRVELLNNEVPAEVVAQETFTISPDNLAPIIKTFNVEQPVSSGPIAIAYHVEDYGLEFGNPTDCSGVKSITIKSGTDVLLSETGSLGACGKENVVVLTLGKTGRQTVCITAKDFVNRESAPSCLTVTLDTEAPTISDFSLVDAEGFILTHVHSGEERTATATVRITDDGEVDPTTVFANFAQLNPNLPESMPPDIAAGEIFSWTGIPVTEVSTCKITVQASDVLGNAASKEFTCDVKADDTAPTVTGIVAVAFQNDKPLYGYGVPLIIELEDEDSSGGPGIGFYASKVYLDLSLLNMGDHVQADVCQKVSGATWKCSWLMTPPENVDEGEYTVALTADSSDDLDNQVGERHEYQIIYDNIGPIKPEVVDFKVVAGEAGVEYQGGAIKGDFVQYTVRSGDFTTAEADFTEIGGNANTPVTGCTDVDDKHKDCTFESLVDLSGPYNAVFYFNFYDEAKNNASTFAKLPIYGIDNETTAKYWKTPPDITCSPRVIDRATASLIPPLAACRVHLTTPRSDITTLTVAGPTSPDDCTGDIVGTVNDIYVVNNHEGSKDPYVFIKLEAKTYNVNETKINCPLEVYSKRQVGTGNETKYYVSPNPQRVPANMTLQFFNNPLGDLEQNINDNIQEAMDDSFANAQWIGDLYKFMRYAEMICRIKVIIGNVIGIYTWITGMLGILATSLKATILGAPAGAVVEGVKVTFCQVEETLSQGYSTSIEFLDTLCSIINCQVATGGKSEWGVANIVGGGVPWCASVQEFLNQLSIPFLEQAAEQAGAQPYAVKPFNIKDSLILSVACLCLPGIIYNVEKFRQVNCFKAVCLHDYVKEQGYPTSYCNEMKGYLTCALVVGEIFSLIPFAAFFDQLINMVLEVLTDPVALFTLGIGAICMYTCPTEGSWAFIGCALAKTVATVGEAVAAYKDVTETKSWLLTPVGDDYCKRMEKIKSEMEE